MTVVSPRRAVCATRRSVVLGVSLLLGVAACGAPRVAATGTGAPTTSTAVFESTRREARLLEMADQRRLDTALVDTLLADTSADRRVRTVLAVGQVRIRTRYPQVRRLLASADTTLAANAALALGLGADTGAVADLARTLVSGPDGVAREAAWALGELGEASRATLERALARGDIASGSIATRAPAIRAATLLATAKLRPAPIALVTPWLADGNADVVRAAAYVVGRLRIPAGIRPVLTVEAHPDEEVRQHVARALTRTAVGDSLAEPALAALRRLARDPSERVRVNVARSLATFGRTAGLTFDSLLTDRAANVRVAAAEVATDVFADDLARWDRAWAADTALAARRLLLTQVRRRGLAWQRGVETTWASSGDWQYRVAALGETPPTGGVVGTAPDTSVARRLVADADVRVRRVARARLGIRDSTVRAPRATGIPPRPFDDYVALARRFLAPGAPRPRAQIITDRGTVTVELLSREAPLIVEAFLRLVQEGRYRNTTWHRVVPNFVAQDGDIGGADGLSPDFMLRESVSRVRHERGCLGLATAGRDTGGSQYYLCHSSQPHLDGGYTVFGRVVAGWDVMDRIVQGDRMREIRSP